MVSLLFCEISISISKAEAKTKIWMEIMKKWQSSWDRKKEMEICKQNTTDGRDREDHWKDSNVINYFD